MKNYPPNSGAYLYDRFDLQLFAGEKTEDPTAKRQGEARNKGQVAKSQELNAVVVLSAAFFTLNAFGPYMYLQVTDFMRFIFTGVGAMHEHTTASVMLLAWNCMIILLKTVGPILMIALVAGLIINYYQVGILFTTQVLEPKFSKLNPIAGFSRMFSLQALSQLAKSLVKIILVTYFVVQFAIVKNLEIAELLGADLFASYKKGGALAMELAFKVLLTLLVLAILDYIYQIWQHNKNLKMSKQEVKEEYKNAEGDPKIKAKIKQKQREMAMRRMMQEIPSASVVVTNPVHLAIALKYGKELNAPVVVAKGKDFLAERIKEIAREHQVVIVENKPLAQALYSIVEVGDIIPPHLYQAVAEVLAYVYRLKKRTGA